VAPARVQIKLRVERGNAVDFAQRRPGAFGNSRQHLDRQVAVFILGVLQNGDQRAFLIGILGQNRL
jgi:hypothetical protein